MELVQGRGGVEQAHVGPAGQVHTPDVLLIKMAVIPQYELLQIGWVQLPSPASTSHRE